MKASQREFGNLVYPTLVKAFYLVSIGSFHVKSTDGFHGPPPILLKFGTLVGIV